MPKTPGQPARVGEPLSIPTRDYNAMLALTKALGGGRGLPLAVGDFSIRNSSGGVIQRFGVLELSSVVNSPTGNLDEFKNNFHLTGITPTGDDVHVAIMQRRCPNSRSAPAILIGPTPVQIDVNAATDEFAKPISGDNTKLESSPTGTIPIIYKETGTGVKWGVVLLGAAASSSLVVAKSTSTITAATGTTTITAGTGTIELYDRSAGTYVPSGTTTTPIINWTDAEIPTDIRLQCLPIGGGTYELNTINCDPGS